MPTYLVGVVEGNYVRGSLVEAASKEDAAKTTWKGGGGIGIGHVEHATVMKIGEPAEFRLSTDSETSKSPDHHRYDYKLRIERV